MKSVFFIFVSLLFISPIVIAEISAEDIKKCEYPESPGIPNGRSASEEKMLAVQKEIKSYMKRGEEYLACLESVEESWGEEITQEHKYLITALHNNIVNEMESVADLFNSALRAYKGKNR